MPFGSLAQKCLAALGVLLLAASCGKPEGSEFAADDWRSEIGTLKMAVEGDVADPEVARRWTGYSSYLERALGLPVKTFQATDYNGVIQAVSSGQVEFAQMGAGSYANIDAQIGDKASPLFVIRQAEGNTGYYSAIIVAADSPYRSLQDLKGKSILYARLKGGADWLCSAG
jgi:phosphonate transport system substrate-binding protein